MTTIIYLDGELVLCAGSTGRSAYQVSKTHVQTRKGRQRIRIPMHCVSHMTSSCKYTDVHYKHPGTGHAGVVSLDMPLIEVEKFLGSAMVRVNHKELVFMHKVFRLTDRGWCQGGGMDLHMQEPFGTISVSRRNRLKVRDEYKKMLARHQKAS